MVITKSCRVSPEHHRLLRMMAAGHGIEIKTELERMINHAWNVDQFTEQEAMQPVGQPPEHLIYTRHPCQIVIAPDAHLDDKGD